MNLTTSNISLHPAPPPSHVRRPLLTPIPDSPGHFLLVVDNSSLEKFSTCPMSARNYLVLGREAHARNAALTFGGAVHAGLETLLRGKEAIPDTVDEGEVWESDFTFDSRIAQSILRHFTENPAPPDEYRTAAVAIELLQHYRSHYHGQMASETWEVMQDSDGPLIERPFELPLGVAPVQQRIQNLGPQMFGGDAPDWLDETEGGIYVEAIHLAWSGRIDLIARCNGSVRVVDHKTTSIAGDQVIQDFILSNQTIGYVWAAQQLYPDLSVSGFCVNFIHLKRPTGGRGFSGPLNMPGPRGGEPALSFFRSYFDYSPERIEWWANNVRHIISDFIHSLTRNYFTSHTKYCFGKYGRCQYHDACVEDNAQTRDAMLMSDMYRTVTWNPVREEEKTK